jgi:hypothetical protein
VSPGGPQWTRRYEALRAHATGEAPLAFVPLGLALLWHRGVAAWMTAEISANDVEGVGQRTARKKPAAPLAPPHSELVRLLAGTALLVARERAS